MPSVKLPAPVMAFAIEPKTKGDEDKAFTALRRLQEEDPTIDLHRDDQTGEQILAGLSQMHVEVIVDRLRSRFGVEVNLKPPRVPYQEALRKEARAHGRHKKQTGGRGQFGDCHIIVEPSASGSGLEFVDEIKGGVIPNSFIPAVEKGVGDVIGDLNSRGGRPQGVEPQGGMSEIKAEVPMAEILTYAPDLRSITGGQGDYTMEFVRYEEVPSQLAQKVVASVAEEPAAV